MEREIKKHIIQDLNKKIVLLSGPRQCGKTTLSKKLTASFDYLNYDLAEDRLSMAEKSWDRQKELIVFDELHKMPEWKLWLKGIYDSEGVQPAILVTGSARLEVLKKVGDSLAGRYFSHRLYPLDLSEILLMTDIPVEQAFDQLWHCSGFPEPFLQGKESYYKRWRKTHMAAILRQDLLDMHALQDIQGIETLVELLKARVGSSVSNANLARDLQRDPNTIKRWLQLLENIYIIYKVTPYSKNIARSLLKEPKYYFYDHAVVKEPSARLENIVANALLKYLHRLEDREGEDTGLHYLRTKEGKEIDFLTAINGEPDVMIEVKTSDDKPSASFKHFSSFLNPKQKIQLVKQLKKDKTYPDGLSIRALIPWLSQLK